MQTVVIGIGQEPRECARASRRQCRAAPAEQAHQLAPDSPQVPLQHPIEQRQQSGHGLILIHRPPLLLRQSPFLSIHRPPTLAPAETHSACRTSLARRKPHPWYSAPPSGSLQNRPFVSESVVPRGVIAPPRVRRWLYGQ